MTEQQRGVILLVKSALTGEKYSLPDGFDWEDAFAIAKKHGITVMLYYGAYNCGADMNSACFAAVLPAVYRAVAVCEQQTVEISRLMEAFEKHGIDYLPLKGVHMRPLYAKPEMRRMSDADILIRYEQYEKIRPVMLELGYEEGVESDHELHWQKKSVHIELHKRIMPTNNADYYAYFGDGWNRAIPSDNGCFRYVMRAEDEMIYMLAHFAKHYREAGIGIRHLVDLWVYRRNYPQLDAQYIHTELDKLRLSAFYFNVMRTASFWMENADGDDKTEWISQVLFDSCEYGTRRAYMLSSIVKNKEVGMSGSDAKVRSLLRRVFVNRKEMAGEYPVLNRFPFLLPFLWISYFFKRMFQKGRMKNCVKRHTDVSESEITAYEKSLQYVGLDFHFSP